MTCLLPDTPMSTLGGGDTEAEAKLAIARALLPGTLQEIA